MFQEPAVGVLKTTTLIVELWQPPQSMRAEARPPADVGGIRVVRRLLNRLACDEKARFDAG